MDRGLVEVTENGVNVEIAIDALLEGRPYLRTPIVGNIDQGARGGGPKLLSRDDLATMTPAEIVAAGERGVIRRRR